MTARGRAAAITAGLPAQGHIWLAFTMPSRGPGRPVLRPGRRRFRGLPEPASTSWPATLPPEPWWAASAPGLPAVLVPRTVRGLQYCS